MLYTLGYRGGWTPNGVRQCITDLAAVLVDARYTPQSRRLPQWRKQALQTLLGDAYVWVQELGNTAYKATPARIEIADLAGGVDRLESLMATHTNVVLLCGCPELTRCHLRMVTAAIGARWLIAAVHLTPAAAPPIDATCMS